MPIYSDFNQFTPLKNPLATDLDSIYQSIGNILSTPRGTRLFLPEFGSTIENLLFEPMDSDTESRIVDAIIVAIERWEPRVKINYARTSVTADYDNHIYRIVITFRVLGLEDNRFYSYSGIFNKLEKM